MLSSKAISSLLASVVIIAFVIAVAGISSTFFSGFTKRQVAGVETKSERIVDCSLAWIDIDEDLVIIGLTISVAVENKGRTDLYGLRIVVYNSSGAFELDTSPDSLAVAEVKVLQAANPGGSFSKIKITTYDCPGVEDSYDITGVATTTSTTTTAVAFTCSDCSDCNTKISNANAGDVIKLNNNINDWDGGTCIDFNGKDNITFDCDGHTIDYDYTGFGNYGIDLDDTGDGSNYNTIMNCYIKEFNFGIRLQSSEFNTLINITSYNNTNDGFRLVSSNSNNLTNLTSYNNSGNGFYLWSSTSNNLANITTSKNNNGLVFTLSDSNTLINIISKDNSFYGLSLYSSDKTKVLNTDLINNGRYDVRYYTSRLDFDCNAEFTNVTGTDNKPIVFYNTSITIRDWGNNASEIILCGADNSVIDNITIDHNDNENNALLLVATQNTSLSNSEFKDLYHGIYLEQSNSNTLINITTNSNSYGGLYLAHSDSNILINITTTNNNFGISFYLSDSSTLNNSKIENNTNGIYLNLAGNPSNQFYNNLFNSSNNLVFGITTYSNYWNITKQTGTRIYSDGTEIGGNYWTNSTGNDYSDTCTDSDQDGFCDNVYDVYNGTVCTIGVNCSDDVDYLPLSDEYSP